MPPSNATATTCSSALPDLSLIVQKIKDPLLRARLVGLTGDNVQCIADFLSTLLHEDYAFFADDKKHLLTHLLNLVKTTQVLPQSYKLQGIQCDFSQPLEGGAYADIFQGDYQGRKVCVKAVRIFQKDDNTQTLKAFAKEIVLWAHLPHENILPFNGIYEGLSGRICIISPWVEGGDLFVYLQNFPNKPRLPLALDIAAGLQYLHQSNIVHGDLKAKNILVSDHGRALIADFGISCIVVSKNLASVQLQGGTTRWMAPELLIFDGETFPSMTLQSDIWSLGCVYYEMFAGKVPFFHCVNDHQVSLARLNPKATPSRPTDGNEADNINDVVWDLMKRCWGHEPCSRPRCNDVHKLIISLIKAQEQQCSQDDALRRAIDGGTETFEPTRPTSIASLETFESGNYSFLTAHSLYQLAETPTESNSGFSDLSATSLVCPDSRIDMIHVTSQESRTATDAGGQRFGNKYDFQSLTERSPRIIAVMGPTGAGKSTFVKAATEVDDIGFGHRLVSCTDEIRAVRCQHPSEDRDIVLVDTPGFDDFFKSDAQILEQIVNWLKDTFEYQAGVKLSGILYLHRITDNRITNTIIRNWDMFQKLCGSDAFSSIILVTTNWDTFQTKNFDEGKANEEQLRNVYRKALKRGSTMLRFDNTHSSAWNIIDSLPETTVSLEIQREMVDEGKSLRDTAAGRPLFAWFRKTKEFFFSIIKRRRRDLLLRDVVDSSGRNNAGTKRYKKQMRNAKQVLKTLNGQERQFSGSGPVR